MSVFARFCSAVMLSLAMTLSALICITSAHAKSPSISPTQKGHILSAYGKLPLAFEQNAGQTDRQVKFLSQGPGYSLFLTPTQTVMALNKGKAPASVLRMTLKGANPTPAVAGQDKLSGQVNYLIGRDKSKWHTHVATYGQVAYKNVYRGIDLRYYGNQRQLEYDFIVRPGADARAITLGFDGTKSVSLTKAGGLNLSTGGGSMQWHAPVVYQTLNGKKVAVAGRFVVSNNTARFTVGKYDHSKSLVIDPALEYSTYLGGNGTDGSAFANTGFGIAVDSTGSAYVTGQTTSSNFPASTTLNGSEVGTNSYVFVTKINPTGTGIVYSTLIGGNSDSGGNGVTVDSSGYANVVGYTYASDFPVTDGSTYTGDGDAFIAQVYPDGTRLFYSKYINPSGMSTASGNDSADAIAIDGSDYIYVAVLTYYDSSYPAITYVAKYDDDGNYQSSRYVFGSSGGTTEPYGVAYGADGNVYVTGYTTDSDLSQANNSYHGDTDAFVAKLDNALSTTLYATYLGGSDQDAGTSIAADSSGNAYVAGYSFSTDFPLTRGSANQGNDEAFVTKISADGTSYPYSTFIDGTPNFDAAYGIVLDSANQAYVTGFSNDTGSGGNTAFITQLDSNGGVLNTQSLTGSDGEQLGQAITLDATGNAYVLGTTASTNFTTTPGTYSRTNSGGVDAFVAKVDYVYPIPTLSGINPSTAFAGSGAFTLDVTGSGFVQGVSDIDFGGTFIPATYVSPSELTATIPASLIASAGSFNVYVYNPSPGGGYSNALPFTVTGSLSLVVSPTAVYQGAPSIGQVTLPMPAASDTTVTLSSSNTGYITVPGSVTIPAGQTSVAFQIASNRNITVDGTSTITASALGTSTSAVSTVLVKYNISGTVTKSGSGGLSGVTVTASGAGTFRIASYIRPAKTIPAGGTLTLPLTAFTVTGSIIDSVVALDITHPNVSQLAITLIAPNGRSVLLHATGSGGQNLLTAYPTLSTPAQSLSTFNGQQIQGVWKVQIQNTGSSTGTVNLYDLNFTYSGTLVETAVTDSTGAYEIEQTKPATFAVVPTLAGYVFAPSSQSVTVGPDQTGVNFTAGTNPTLTSVSPTSAYAGDGNTTITLTGTNFVSGAIAYFNGTALSTHYVSSTSLTAVVPASLLTTTGTASITVSDPAPGGTSGAVTFTVKPRLKTLSLSPTSVTGGTSVTGTVTLTGAAPISGTTITLASSSTGVATTPGTVTVAGGATSATFTVTTKSVTSTATVTITATGPGATKTATLTVIPVTLSDLELSSAVTAGGTGVTATVTLSGPAPTGGTKVTPSTSNTAVATVPSSVTVAAGAKTATFTVTTKAVTANTSVVIGVALGTVTKSKTLTVTPAAPVTTVQSLSVSPTSVKGGAATSTGTVTLTAPAPSGGLAVSLSSSSTAAATVASTLNIAAGATTAKFKITTYAVTSTKTITITAAANGASKSATLTVTTGTVAPVTVQSLSLSPTSVKGGAATSTGTVTLTAPAPSGGLAVSLSSSSTAAATVASTLNIAAGATTAKFKITTYAVTSTKTVTITAAANGASKSATLTVTH